MPEKPTVEALYQRCITLIEVSEEIVRTSALLDDDEKRDCLADYGANRGGARSYAGGRKASFLRQLEEKILTPWNESSDEDSDKFFRLAAGRRIELARKDYLGTVLARGWIASFEEYEVVADSLAVWEQNGRIDAAQARRLGEMSGAYESKRR